RTGHRRSYEGWQPRRGRRGAPSSVPQEEHNQPPRADSNSSIARPFEESNSSLAHIVRRVGFGARGVGLRFRGRGRPLLAVRGEVARPTTSDDGPSAGHSRSGPRKGTPTPREPATGSPATSSHL